MKEVNESNKIPLRVCVYAHAQEEAREILRKREGPVFNERESKLS